MLIGLLFLMLFFLFSLNLIGEKKNENKYLEYFKYLLIVFVFVLLNFNLNCFFVICKFLVVCY